MKRVLIVDDNEIMLHLYRRILETEGYQVMVQANPAEALERVTDHDRFDLILVDCLMPQMMGDTFIRELRQRHPSVADAPIVGFSNLGNNNPLCRKMHQDVVAFVEKPDDLQDLVDLVQKYAAVPGAA